MSMRTRGSPSTRRHAASEALVRAHPRWRGIHHPEAIDFLPRRFSRLDVLPALEREGACAAERRARHNADVVAAHPRWRGVRHPELIDFAPQSHEWLARHGYLASIRLALQRLERSEELYDEIVAAAEGTGPAAVAEEEHPASVIRLPAARPLPAHVAHRLAA